jgi:hypothetical protein
MYLFSDTDERLISPGMGEEARHRGNVYCNLSSTYKCNFLGADNKQ